METSKKIQYIRKNFKLTQSEFATKLGLDRITVSAFETGKRNPSERVLRAICQVFEINEQWLVDDKDVDPFNISVEKQTRELTQAYKLDDLMSSVLKSYLSLTPEEQKAVSKFIKNLNNL